MQGERTVTKRKEDANIRKWTLKRKKKDKKKNWIEKENTTQSTSFSLTFFFFWPSLYIYMRKKAKGALLAEKKKRKFTTLRLYASAVPLRLQRISHQRHRLVLSDENVHRNTAESNRPHWRFCTKSCEGRTSAITASCVSCLAFLRLSKILISKSKQVKKKKKEAGIALRLHR